MDGSESNEQLAGTRPPGADSAMAGNPWERRAELGAANAFFEAVKLFVTAPTTAFAQTIRAGDFGSPLLFAIIVGWLGVAIGQVWETLMGASILSVMPAEVRNQIPFIMGTAGSLVINVILAPVFVIVGIFIWSAILHLCLIIVGGLESSRAGFEGSFRVVAYSTVAQLGNLVPILGGMICLVWSIVLAVIGTRQIHGTPQGKAVTAVLIPLLLCCACVAMALFLAGAGMMAMFAQQ